MNYVGYIKEFVGFLFFFPFCWFFFLIFFVYWLNNFSVLRIYCSSVKNAVVNKVSDWEKKEIKKTLFLWQQIAWIHLKALLLYTHKGAQTLEHLNWSLFLPIIKSFFLFNKLYCIVNKEKGIQIASKLD